MQQCRPIRCQTGMMHRSLILVISGIFIVVSCSKRAPNCCILSAIEMTRTQTQCSDPWGYGSSREENISKLNTYLQQRQIEAGSIDLQPTGETLLCNACGCSNGFKFSLYTQTAFVDTLKRLGFARK